MLGAIAKWRRQRVARRLLDSALALGQEGRLEEAAEILHGAKASLTAAAVAAPDSVHALERLTRVLRRIGDLAREQMAHDAARICYQHEVDLHRTGLNLANQAPRRMWDLVRALGQLGDASGALGDGESARDSYAERLRISREIAVLEGETEDALRAISDCLRWLGDEARKQGDRARAIEFWEQGLEHDRRLLSMTGAKRYAESVDLGLRRLTSATEARGPQSVPNLGPRSYRDPREESTDLRIDGDNALARGDLVEALRLYEQRVGVLRRIVAQDIPAPSLLRDLSQAILLFADVSRRAGRLDAAERGHRDRLEVEREILRRDGDRWQTRDAIRSCLVLIGELAEEQRKPDAAYAAYMAAIKSSSHEVVLAPGSPDALRNLSHCQYRAAVVLEALDQIDAAFRMHEEAFKTACAALATGSRPQESLIRGDRGAPEGGGGGLHGKPTEAWTMAQWSKTNEIGARYLILAVRLSLEQLSTSTQARRQFDRALAVYERTLSTGRAALVAGPKQRMSTDAIVDLTGLGDEEHARVAATLKQMLEQSGLLLRVNTQLGTWPGDVAAHLADCLVALARAGILAEKDALAYRTELWECLHEHVDMADLQVLHQARPDIARFHGQWLLLTLERAPASVPAVLASMQGRKIAALVLDEMEQPPSAQGFAETFSLHQQFVRLRAELRRVALSLRAQSQGNPQDVGLGSSDAIIGRPKVQSAFASASEYQAKLSQCRRAFSALAQRPGYEALRPPQMDAADLRTSLPDEHGLLILVQPPQDGEASKACQGLLLRRDDCRLVPLPLLAKSVARVRARIDAPPQLQSVRHAGSARRLSAQDALANQAEATDPEIGWDVVGGLNEALWAPLGSHLQGLCAIHVVTVGELHVLPLQQPDGQVGPLVYQYPGLVFYWMLHGVSQPAPAGEGLALQVYSPPDSDEDPPIPFVHAEARMTAELWTPVRSSIHWGEVISARIVHLAGHGDAGRDQDATLLIGKGQTLSLRDLLRSRVRPEVAYLNACLVGRTSEDLDGDPLGMVSAFFLRGARCVVASLVPISDLYAPILAVLFHWALKGQGDDAELQDGTRALTWAKGRLQQGDWPEDIVKLVRDAYSATFAGELAEILHGRVRRSDGRPVDGRQELMTVMSRWFVDLLGPIGLRDLRDRIDVRNQQHGAEAAAQWGAERLAEMLVAARTRLKERPEVQDLVTYMQVYGAPCRVPLRRSVNRLE